jgi:hypothetical protein
MGDRMHGDQPHEPESPSLETLILSSACVLYTTGEMMGAIDANRFTSHMDVYSISMYNSSTDAVTSALCLKINGATIVLPRNLSEERIDNIGCRYGYVGCEEYSDCQYIDREWLYSTPCSYSCAPMGSVTIILPKMESYIGSSVTVRRIRSGGDIQKQSRVILSEMVTSVCHSHRIQYRECTFFSIRSLSGQYNGAIPELKRHMRRTSLDAYPDKLMVYIDTSCEFLCIIVINEDWISVVSKLDRRLLYSFVTLMRNRQLRCEIYGIISMKPTLYEGNIRVNIISNSYHICA